MFVRRFDVSLTWADVCPFNPPERYIPLTVADLTRIVEAGSWEASGLAPAIYERPRVPLEDRRNWLDKLLDG